MATKVKSVFGRLLGLDANGNLVLGKGSKIQYGGSRVVASTAASLSLTKDEHAEKIVVINKADGSTATLPAATGSGDKYTVVVGTTVASNNLVIGVTGDDTMFGTIYGDDGDGEPANGWSASAGNNKVTLGGSSNATGGVKGDKIEFTDIAADEWEVKGWITQSGSEATPFGTAA